MHGRLKIKTTAQQEAEKKKERAVKLGKDLLGFFEFLLNVKYISSRLQESYGGNIIPAEGGGQGRDAAQADSRGADGQPRHPHPVEHQVMPASDWLVTVNNSL